LQDSSLTELVLTAYDIRMYLSEALPALRAAIYRSNLAAAKDVLALYDDTLYDEHDLYDALAEGDHSWIFTESAIDSERLDPDGRLVGLTYPLILTYHHPDLFRMIVGGSEFGAAALADDKPQVDLPGLPGTQNLIQPGFREGLRAMWEIVGYISPEDTAALRETALAAVRSSGANGISRLLERLAEGLKPVIEHGYGLVLERE
jgi:hypothetical protein